MCVNPRLVNFKFYHFIGGLLLLMCRMPSANHSMSKTGAFKNPMIALSGQRLKFLKNVHELEYEMIISN